MAIEKAFVATSFGNIAYLEVGKATKPPLLFVHGIPTSSYLWRRVLRFLQNDFHCYAPDLMGLGDTVVDPDKTPLHMDAQAEMLLEFMDKIGHTAFGLVAHDQGGAAAQIIAARQPERLTALVLADVVCYDNWPVPTIARLQSFARLPLIPNLAARTGLIEWIEARTPFSSFRRALYEGDKLSEEAIREYLRPLRASKESRERFLRFLLAGHPRYTELVVPRLKQFEKPTLILWAGDDPHLSPSWGQKLFEDIPGAKRFELIPFCGHFWQEERPSHFASKMGEFLSDVYRELHSASKTEPEKEKEKTKSPTKTKKQAKKKPAPTTETRPAEG